MLPKSKSQVVGEADERVQQRGLQFQSFDDVYGQIMPPVSGGSYLEMGLPSKNDCSQFQWGADFSEWPVMET